MEAWRSVVQAEAWLLGHCTLFTLSMACGCPVPRGAMVCIVFLPIGRKTVTRAQSTRLTLAEPLSFCGGEEEEEKEEEEEEEKEEEEDERQQQQEKRNI